MLKSLKLDVRFLHVSLAIIRESIRLKPLPDSHPEPYIPFSSAVLTPITTEPKVSVLMTVYNGMPHLVDAIASVLDQSFADFQFVIVDDGSTDGTPDFLKSIDDPRVLILRQENKGTAAAANFGLTKCVGQYVARMDADDVALSLSGCRFRQPIWTNTPRWASSEARLRLWVIVASARA